MKLKNDDQAVSPVIAVILLVAITVVLAATVFILVSDIIDTNTPTTCLEGWNQTAGTCRPTPTTNSTA